MDNNKNNDEEFLDIPRRSRHGHNANSHRFKDPSRNRKRICLTLLSLAIIAFVGAGFYFMNILNNTKASLNSTYSSTNVKKMRNVSDVLKKKKPFSVLILGTDTGDLGRHDKGRTDTMILMTVNPKTKNVAMLSIPRDTEVHVPGSGDDHDKINAAYTLTGVNGAIKTVQNMLDVPIDFYMLVNMGGLTKTVDAVGGVTVDPPLTFKYGAANVKKHKKVTLNGKQALDYSRMRHDDPLGDYGRQYRQRQVIQSLIHKALSVSSITRYRQLLNSIDKNMKTDMTYSDMVTIETNYKSAGRKVKSYVLQGDNATIDGLSYQVASANEKKKKSDIMRKQLGLAPSTQDFSAYSDAGTGADVDSSSSSAVQQSSSQEAGNSDGQKEFSNMMK